MKKFLSFFTLFILVTIILYTGNLLPVYAQSISTNTSPDNEPPEKRGPSSLVNTNLPLPTDRLIIKFKEKNNVPVDEQSNPQVKIQALSQQAGEPLTYIRKASGDTHIVSLNNKIPYQQALSLSEELVKQNDDIEYVQPDQIRRHTLSPNDTFYNLQWHYQASNPSNYGINLTSAWDITTGSADVVVAVIDTGIVNHVDLSGKILAGYDFIDNILVANDGNGRDTDPSDPGDWEEINECSDDGKFWPSSWHGTHVAGTIGASSNNGEGVAGISWGAKILPIRVLGKCGGYDSDIIDGVRWAAGLSVPGVPDNPTPSRILNLSLSGYGACSTLWQAAINDVRARGASVIVAAGNSNDNASYYSPANCSGVITVGATDQDGWLATYSNYGPTLEISAPGGDFGYDTGILSTLNSGTTTPAGDTYNHYQGTSMATPHISGVVALMLSLQPDLAPDLVLSILQENAQAFGQNWCKTSNNCGVGILDAAAALESIENSNIRVNIGGQTNGLYTLASLDNKLEKYAIANGPVIVESDNGTNIIASLLQLRRPASTGPWTGITQLMAIPDGQLSHAYVFPYYDATDPTKYNSINFSNFDDVSRDITVTIAGVAYGPYTVGAKESYTIKPNVTGGPVVVSTTPGAKIIAQIYELKRAGTSGKYNGQSQMMGMPIGYLTDTVILPWYNNTLNDLDATLVIANAGAASTQVTIRIAGDEIESFPLPLNTAILKKYAVSGGPVVIESDGQPIVASLLQLRRPTTTGGWTGITQLMAIPDGQLSHAYVFPYYDATDPTKYNSINFSNFDNVSRDITVTIAGVSYGPFTVGAKESYTFRPEVTGGPVIVSTTPGAKIIAQIYELKRAGTSGKYNGQSQMMGMPIGYLTDTAILPWYNNTLNDLDATLIFGLP